MAKVTLVEYTGKGRNKTAAQALLAFTKSTRLQMDPDGLADIEGWPSEILGRTMKEMSQTIPSSWEFVDVTFAIENVTRACAQQITRTRTGSYAMQSQRVADVSGATYRIPDSILDAGSADKAKLYQCGMEASLLAYKSLVEHDVPREDARGVLPINIHCNLVAKYNLRSFVELVLARRSLRTQGEYAGIVDQMYCEVIKVWPWAAPFFTTRYDAAIDLLQSVIDEIGITTGSGPGWQIAKAIDLLRKA